MNSESVDGRHTYICSGCRYAPVIPMTYTNQGVYVGHSVACSQCSYYAIEAHEWANLKGTYRCLKCNATSAFIPTNSLPPEILELIQTKKLVGDFALSIDEDMVLCRVDGEYYFVKGQTEDTALQYLRAELASLTVVKPELETE